MTNSTEERGTLEAKVEQYRRALFVSVGLIIAILGWEVRTMRQDVDENTSDINALTVSINSLSNSVTTLSQSVDRLEVAMRSREN